MIQRTLGVGLGILIGGAGGLGAYHYCYAGIEEEDKSQDNFVELQSGKKDNIWHKAFERIAN